MSEPTVITTVTLERLAEMLRAAGYRAQTGVDAAERPLLHSAAQGLNFLVCPGNALPQAADQFADFAFNCALRVEGAMRPEAIEDWNRGKRFARLYREGELLVLTMDVMVAGGVSATALQAHCELWDRLLREFLAHLRSTPMLQPAEAAKA